MRCVTASGGRYREVVRREMVRAKSKTSQTWSGDFSYSYIVLLIASLLTTGATLAYYRHSAAIDAETAAPWTPVVFLIGLCVSLVIFAMTHREAAARRALQQRTLDLLEAKKRNDELLAAEQASRIAAEHANVAKDEFLALISHELKTPLNAIAGWNRVLKTRGISDETRETALEKIDKNLRTQAAAVDELLNFSDVMSERKAGVDKRPVRMREVFEDAVTSVSVAAFQKGITLASIDSLDGERLLGDRSRLRLAIVNVLSNAVKFTPPGGSIEARAFESQGFVRCVVSDTGVGMSDDVIPHIFEKYRQSEHASTRHYGGLGLGLAIADRIVRLHNGKIEAESAGPGKGSTFTISIPIGAGKHAP